MDIQLNLSTETVTHAHAGEPLCVEPERSIRDVLGLLKEHHSGSVMICRGDRLLGIFTERDALRLMASGALLDRPIESVMTPEPMVLHPDDTVATAITAGLTASQFVDLDLAYAPAVAPMWDAFQLAARATL